MAAKLLISIILASIIAVFWILFLKKRSMLAFEVILHDFGFGIISALPLTIILLISSTNSDFDPISLLIKMLNTNIFVVFTIIFLFIGITEEIIKFMFLIITMKHKKALISPIVAFYRACFVALGFASVENIIYMHKVVLIEDYRASLAVFLIRASIATLGHILFTGMIAYFYGKRLLGLQKKSEKCSLISRIRRKTNPKNKIKPVSVIIVFMLLISSILLHALFDLFAHLEMAYLNIPIIVILFNYFQGMVNKGQKELRN